MIITHHQDKHKYTVEFTELELSKIPELSDGYLIEELIIKLAMLASSHRKLQVFDSHRDPVIGANIVTHLNEHDDRLPALAVQIY